MPTLTEDERAELVLLRRNANEDTPGPWIQRAFDALGTAKANAARVETMEKALVALRREFTHGGLYLSNANRERLVAIVDAALSKEAT